MTEVNYFSLFLLISLLLIGIMASIELFSPNRVPWTEAFVDAVSPSFWINYNSRRSDIDDVKESADLIRDPRYFHDYADVQALGDSSDFCRMVAPKTDPTNLFFACALAGTEDQSSTSYRTQSQRPASGVPPFRVSYDDYMRDVNGDGRAEYCRILNTTATEKANTEITTALDYMKSKNKVTLSSDYLSFCATAGPIAFDTKETVDPDPPTDIVTLLTFYQGCAIWFRFHEDIKDTVGNATATLAGRMRVDETPRREKTEGIQFDGAQFIRLTDSPVLGIGAVVPLRSVRAFMVWVYFDEFTNNAHIFDFGNGAGKDNVFLGILKSGDPKTEGADTLGSSGSTCESQPSTVPACPSGAQPVYETTPKNWMETSAANVNDFVSGGFEISPRKLSPSSTSVTAQTGAMIAATTALDPALTPMATLLYEVWDKASRKLQIKVNGVIPLKKWTHIAVAATNSDAFRPSLGVYINGTKVLDKLDAFLPSTDFMTNCYLGKSNWVSTTSLYDNKDELFKGRMFDFRAYTGLVSARVINDSVDWGKIKLGLNTAKLSADARALASAAAIAARAGGRKAMETQLTTQTVAQLQALLTTRSGSPTALTEKAALVNALLTLAFPTQ